MSGTGERQAERLRVFISYSRRDTDIIDQLVAALDAAGFEPQLDRHGTSAGEAWKPRLSEMIARADTVIFALSPEAASSPVCEWEIEETQRLGKRLIPIVIKPLGGVSVPERLSRLDYTFFYAEKSVPGSGFGEGLRKLVAALRIDIEWLREGTRYGDMARRWEAGGAAATNRLLSGADIALAKAWQAKTPRDVPETPEVVLRFIRESDAHEARRQADEAARAERLRDAELATANARLDAVRQVQRRTRLALIVVSLLAIVAAGASGLAWWQWREALAAAAEAERQKAEAERQRAMAEQALDAVDALVLEITDGLKDNADVPNPRLRGVLERVEGILDALPINSDSPSILRRRMRMSLVLARAKLVAGDTTQALRRATMALEIARSQHERAPQDVDWQRDLSLSFGVVGDARVAQGDLAGALRSYEAGREITERLARSDPGNAGWQRDLAVNSSKVGDLQLALGDLAGALRSYNASREITERLASSDPGNTGWQRDLAVSLAKLGDLQQMQGDLAGALYAYQASIAIRQRLASLDPGNAGWQRDLSASLNKIGDVQQARGDLAGALGAFQASRAILERLATSDPDNAVWQFDLFASHWRIAETTEGMSGRLAESREQWRRAVEIISGLAAARRLTPEKLQYVEAAKKRLAAVEARLAAGER